MILFILLLLVVPVIISLTHTIFSVKCSVADGFLFYAINTVPSVLFGVTFGLLSLRYLNKYPKILFFSIFFIIALIPVLEFYFNPQIYFYNLFLGYFPGTIYDEAIAVDLKLIIYRLFNLFYFVPILYLLNKKKLPDYILSLVVIMPFFLFMALSPVMGFNSNKWKLENDLGGKCTSEHFEIIYDKGINRDLLKNIILHHESYYNDLKKFYRFETDKKITSFLFKDHFQKSILFGAENADVAKPWLNQVYTTVNNYNTTLKHEISHIFSAKIGSGLFKVARGLNPALIEGIAVASDPFYNNLYIDQLAALAYKFNYRINIDGLYSGFSFFGSVSSLSYIYSGSFCNFLIQKFGIDKFSRWYSGNEFESTYGFTFSVAEKDYIKYLSSLSFERNENLAKLLFARQTIFTKVCPRYIGSRLKKAIAANNSGDLRESENIFREILSITPNYSAFSGLVNSLIKQKREKEALEEVIKYSKTFNTSGMLFNYELLSADVHVLNSDIKTGDSIYNNLYNQQPTINYKMMAELRGRLLRENLLKEYLKGTNSEKYDILKKLNEQEIFYSSIPALISLAEELNIPKNELMKLFDTNWQMVDGTASYSATLVSDYLMEKSDFEWSRKYSVFAYKLNSGGPTLFLRSYFLKSEWIYLNREEVMKKVMFIL